MTTQICDRCVISGETYYFSDLPPTVSGTPCVVDSSDPPKDVLSCCWRGYVADWHIEGGHLYINAIEGKYQLAGTAAVLADWVQGDFDLRKAANSVGHSDASTDCYRLKVVRGAVYVFAPVSNQSADAEAVEQLSASLKAAGVHPSQTNPVSIAEQGDIIPHVEMKKAPALLPHGRHRPEVSESEMQSSSARGLLFRLAGRFGLTKAKRELN